MAKHAVAGKPDTQEMVVVHRVFRREFRLAPQIVGQVAEDPDAPRRRAAPAVGGRRLRDRAGRAGGGPAAAVRGSRRAPGRGGARGDAAHREAPDRQEWAELGERGRASIPKPRMLVVLGHILEDTSPEERRSFLGQAPPPVRLLYRLVGQRTFEREVAVLRRDIPVQRHR